MKNLFDFMECHLSDKLLSHIGFSEWWGDPGDSCSSQIDLGGGVIYRIHCIDEKEDDADGYGTWPVQYQPYYYTPEDFGGHIYFLHQLFNDIALRSGEAGVNAFIDLCKKKNLWPYLESYLKYIHGSEYEKYYQRKTQS